MSAHAGQVLAMDGPNGVLFGLYHPPATRPCRGRVLLLPALAEEFNTCHRVCALACRQMAQAGFAVLRFDLSGTGDSDGRLADLGWPPVSRDFISRTVGKGVNGSCKWLARSRICRGARPIRPRRWARALRRELSVGGCSDRFIDDNKLHR